MNRSLSFCKNINLDKMTATLIMDRGDQVDITGCNLKYEVCDQCQGQGRILNPALMILTERDHHDDPDLREDLHKGIYDLVCPVCKGLRVCLVVDVKLLPRSAKSFLKKAQEEIEQSYRDSAQERRNGA